VLGGFFGVGGTWIVTPGLNLLGLPIAFAVGTDLLHTMGKSIVATIKHRRVAVTRAPRGAGKVRLYEKVQALKLPPYLSLPASGIPRISAWVPFLLAL